MSSLSLNSNLYIHITSLGAHYAVQDNASDITRDVLQKLLLMDDTPELSDGTITNLYGTELDDASNTIQRMQSLGLISVQPEIEIAPEQDLEDILEDLLAALSDSKKVLLAEHSGLYLGTSGFTHEAAEELAAISAKLSEVYQRHKRLLQDNLTIKQHAWGLIDASGNSEVGFWPLYIGYNQFSLVIQGKPQLNRPTYKHLIWSLMRRYGGTT